MMLRYNHISRYAKVFQSMTGLSIRLFNELQRSMEPALITAEVKRLNRPDRQRGLGGGRSQEIEIIDQMLLTVVWLRCYPKQHVLAYLFGVSESSVSRVLHRVLPLLEQHGRDTMRLPDPGRKRRRELDELLKATPELAVVIDSFEQRRQAADAHYSGKKRQHTLKSQVAIDEESDQLVDVSASVPGPTADLKLIEDSKLLERLPAAPAVSATLPISASTNCTPPPMPPPLGASPETSRVPPRTWPSTRLLRVGASLLNIR
jgi:hypothetical protein